MKKNQKFKKKWNKKMVKNNKSAFYLHHYPDGDGPDGILIETFLLSNYFFFAFSSNLINSSSAVRSFSFSFLF